MKLKIFLVGHKYKQQFLVVPNLFIFDNSNAPPSHTHTHINEEQGIVNLQGERCCLDVYATKCYVKIGCHPSLCDKRCFQLGVAVPMQRSLNSRQSE